MITATKSEITAYPSPLLVYDGSCGFCYRSVRFILRHERRHDLSFVTRNSELGKGLRRTHGMEAVESMLWIESGQVFAESGAVMKAAGIFPAGAKHLYLHCEGQRHGPAVILDAGLFRDSTDWKLVLPEAARFTQVCSYDREGLGQSKVDRGVSPESECIDEQVEDLRSLLSSARVVPPYLLVGHSGGGIRVRRYTRDHPDEVAGLVFVDSAHEEQLWRFLAIDLRSIQGPPADPNRAGCGGMLRSLESVWFGTTISR